MKLISLKCTNCGADLEVDSSRESCFCSYCGHKLLIDDESVKVKGGFDFGYEQEIGRRQAIKDIEKLKELKEQRIELQAKYNKYERTYNNLSDNALMISDKKWLILIASVAFGLCVGVCFLTNPEYSYLNGIYKFSIIWFIICGMPIASYGYYRDNKDKAQGYKKKMDKIRIELDKMDRQIKQMEFDI